LSVSFLDPSWRATFNDEVWNIRAITPADQRDHRVNITVERGVAV
jgi:head-tail adaptor